MYAKYLSSENLAVIKNCNKNNFTFEVNESLCTVSPKNASHTFHGYLCSVDSPNRTGKI